MQRDIFRRGRLMFQLTRDSSSLGGPGRRLRAEYGRIAMPFCDRIYQPVDFPGQLALLLLKALPSRV